MEDYYLSELGEYEFHHSSGVCGYQFYNSSRVNVYKITYRVHYSLRVLSLLICPLFICVIHVTLSSNNIVRVFLLKAKPQNL